MHLIIRALFAVALATLATGPVPWPAAAQQPISADEIRAHLRFLAHDLLEGRAPGTRGGRIAAEYIATEMTGAGLAPLNGSYFQPVPLTGVTVRPDRVRLGFAVTGAPSAPRAAAADPDPSGEEAADGDASDRSETAASLLVADYPEEAVVWPGSPDPAVDVNGELVFVGYGVVAPEFEWDDYEGQDVRGKVVLILVGDPPAPPEEPALFDGRALTYYGRWTYKLEEARRQGAAGALLVHRTDAAGYGWDVVVTSWTGEQLMPSETRDAAGRPPLGLNGWLEGGFARRALAAGGLSLDELFVRAARRDFRPVRTGIAVRALIGSDSRPVLTRNVVGLLPGTDGTLAAEAVIVTSHYDHLGIGVPDGTGDSIYNGAYDNASGVALLLEIARSLASTDARRARSVLFIATAAEEAGLLGARRYVSRPLIPLARTVAALNIDGGNLWGETADLIDIGGEYSSLGPLLAARAAEREMVVRPDPAPQTGIFFRSDHFPFARAGVPVLYIEHGIHFRDRPIGWGEELMDRQLSERYHQPGDEYRPDFDLSGAVQQATIIRDVVLDLTSGEVRPAWNAEAPYRRPGR